MSTEAPEVKVPVWDCGTCADRGAVGLLLESAAGPQRKEIPCPDCGGSPLHFASARDAAIRTLDDRIKNIGVAIIVLAVAVLLSFAIIWDGVRKATKSLPKIDLTDIGEGVKPNG